VHSLVNLIASKSNLSINRSDAEHIFKNLSVPVYSLATASLGEVAGGGRAADTMNIVTYCSPVAIHPARKIVVSLYVDTLSWENFRTTKRGVLQILNKRHLGIVKLLGTQSGRDIDKLSALADQGHPVTRWNSIPILRECSAGILLQGEGELIDCGDHQMAVCNAVDYYQPAGGDQDLAPWLHTKDLREQGII